MQVDIKHNSADCMNCLHFRVVLTGPGERALQWNKASLWSNQRLWTRMEIIQQATIATVKWTPLCENSNTREIA